jgi:ribosomal protein L21E
MTKFKVGDRVRVRADKSAHVATDHDFGWVERMDRVLGTVGVVVATFSHGVEVEFPAGYMWTYNELSLEATCPNLK